MRRLGVPLLALLWNAAAVSSAAAAPLLSLTNSDSPDPVQAGATLTYTLAFANSGADDATTVVLNDVIPTNTTFSSATCSQGSCVLVSGVARCTLGTVAAGGIGSCTLRVNVRSPLANGTLIPDAANLSDAEGDSVNAGEITTVSSSPNRALLNTDNPDPALAGETVTNTISVNNTGNANATGVTIIDTLDANTSFVGATCPPLGGCTASGGVVTCNVGSLAAPTGSVTCAVTSQLAFPLVDGTVLTNCATSTDNEGDSVTPACATTTVQGTNLTLGVSDGVDPVRPGDWINLRLRFANRRASDATDVVVTDTLPPGTALVATSGGGTLAGSVVTWNLGAIPAGGSRSVDVVLAVDSSVADGAMLTHAATITDAEGDETDATESTAVATTPVLALGIVEGADPVAGGATPAPITTQIRIVDRGPANAPNVIVTIPDPTHTDPATVTVSAPPVPPSMANPCTRDAGTRTSRCTFGSSIGIGDERVITVTATPQSMLPVGSLITWRATAVDLNGHAAEAVAHTLVEASGPLPLALTKSGDAGPVQAGTSLVYTLGYSTTGSGELLLTDPIPPEVTLTSVSCDAPGAMCTCDTTACGTTSRLVSCDIPAPPPATGSCILTVAIPPATTALVVNRAQIDGDGHSAEAVASTRVRADLPRTELTVVDFPDPVPLRDIHGAQGQIIYSIHYLNPGNAVLPNVVIVTKTPGRTLFVSADGTLDSAVPPPVVGRPARVRWKVGDVAPETGGDLTLVVQLKTSAKVGKLIKMKKLLMQSGSFIDLTSAVTTVGTPLAPAPMP